MWLRRRRWSTGEVAGGVDRAETTKLGEGPRAERGREAHGLELATTIGVDGERELVGGDEGLSLVEVDAGVVGGIGEAEHGGVKRDNAGGRRCTGSGGTFPSGA